MKHLTLPRLLFLLAAAPFALATSSAVSATTTHTPACTATASAGIGGFFDLRPDIAIAAEDGKTKRGARATDYEARGYDYKSNFTLNICASVLKPVEEVVGLKRSEWKNVSAYYVHGGDVFSIGSVIVSFPISPVLSDPF
jgi:cation-dependent mannose-6-phosphate receptor